LICTLRAAEQQIRVRPEDCAGEGY
jgi:hypothetical protein